MAILHFCRRGDIDGESAEQVFEGGGEVGLLVAVLDDDGSVDGEAPLGGFAFGDGARAGQGARL